jgi:hypothetical protein
MTSITFTADDELIDAARERARRERTTLDEQFQRWLTAYARPRPSVEETMAFLDELSYADTGGRKFTRDELNER